MRPTSRVRDAIDHYCELLSGKHGRSTREQLIEATARFNLRYFDKRPLCIVLRPNFIESHAYAESCRAATLVNRAIRHFTERLLADRKRAVDAGIPEYLQPILDLDRRHGEPPAFARLDGILDEDGTIKFIEYNSEPGSILDADTIDAVFSAMPIARDFAQRFSFRTVPALPLAFDALYDRHRQHGKHGAPCIGVVRSTADASFDRVLLWLGSQGCRVMIARLAEFNLANGLLTVEKRPIDIVLAPWRMFFDPPPEAKPLLEALSTGAVRAFRGLSRGLTGSAKVLFDLLSDPTQWDGLDNECTEALAAHVPWTRRVRQCTTSWRGGKIDLVPFVAEHRADLVLKPSGSLGGEGVVLGWTVDDARWRVAVEKALARPHVVQERVVSPTELYPVLTDESFTLEERQSDFNPFVWNGERAEGHFIRATRSGVHNLSGGSSLLAKWILEN